MSVSVCICVCVCVCVLRFRNKVEGFWVLGMINELVILCERMWSSDTERLHQPDVDLITRHELLQIAPRHENTC